MKYRIGFCQYKPALKNVDENIKKISEMLDGVKADLLVFPELAMSGYVFQNRQEVLSVSEDPKNSKTIEFFKKISVEKNMSCVVGFPEKAYDKNGNDIVYNSAFLTNPDGSIHIYRKIHLFNKEKELFLPGDGEFTVLEAKGGIKIGMMICFDWIFPESARTLALKGAKIICHPSNLVLPWCQKAMITRSIENRVFTITSNRTGKEDNGNLSMTFTGGSQVTSPNGQVIIMADQTEESIFITEINPYDADNKDVTDFNHIFNDRRPEKYHN